MVVDGAFSSEEGDEFFADEFGNLFCPEDDFQKLNDIPFWGNRTLSYYGAAELEQLLNNLTVQKSIKGNGTSEYMIDDMPADAFGVEIYHNYRRYTIDREYTIDLDAHKLTFLGGIIPGIRDNIDIIYRHFDITGGQYAR
jgi:hypothetical protein